MVELHLVAQRVDELLQRLDSLGKLKVLHNKRADGVVQNFAQGVCQNGKLVPRVAGEGDPLLVDLLRSLCHVQRMVGDTLKIGDRMQEFRNVRALAAGELPAGQLDKIRAQNVLVPVDHALHPLHLGKVLVGVVFQKRQRAREVELRVGGHGVDRDAALLDGKRRVLQKALFQVHRGGLVGVLFLALVLDERVHNCLNHIRKRQQDHDLHKAEEGVDKRDGNARHRHIHKIEPEHGVREIKSRRPKHNACDFDHEIDHGRALAVNVRADCGQKHRQRCADGNAHDDGKRDGKIDHARRSQRLQNADRRRSALQHAGKERTK